MGREQGRGSSIEHIYYELPRAGTREIMQRLRKASKARAIMAD